MLLLVAVNISQQREPVVLLTVLVDKFYITFHLNQILIHNLRKLFIMM